MANFKRGKTKRNVRCTICTTHKWMGNNKGRKKSELSNHRDMDKIRKEIGESQVDANYHHIIEVLSPDVKSEDA